MLYYKVLVIPAALMSTKLGCNCWVQNAYIMTSTALWCHLCDVLAAFHKDVHKICSFTRSLPCPLLSAFSATTRSVDIHTLGVLS